MSEDGTIELVWAGDERKFRLGIAELLALQERRGCGVVAIYDRFRDRAWFVQDIQETLRLGLVGAGVEGKDARELIDANVKPGEIEKNALTAYAVLICALQGDPREPAGKVQAATEAPEMDISPLPPITEVAQS